jgi:hypothetical protein
MWAHSAQTKITYIGAGNETRTRNPQLGRLMLYQLSYSRLVHKYQTKSQWWRGEDSNLRRRCRQIYSLFPLATREPLHSKLLSGLNLLLYIHCHFMTDLSLYAQWNLLIGAGDGTRTRNLLITNQLLCQLSYASMQKKQIYILWTSKAIFF